MNHGKLLVCLIIEESDPWNCDSLLFQLYQKFLEDDRCYFELRLNSCGRLIIIYLVSLICFTECIRIKNLCYEVL